MNELKPYTPENPFKNISKWKEEDFKNISPRAK